MIQLSVFSFLAVLEIAVVFAILWLWWFLKSRRQAREIIGLRSLSNTAAPPTAETDLTAETYILQELAATHEQLGVQCDTAPELSTAPLTLRAAYLDLERELAQSPAHDAEFWARVRERLASLLEEFAPPAAPAVESRSPEDEMLAALQDETFAFPDAELPVPADPAAPPVEPQRVKQLMDAQVSTITELKDVLAAMVGDQDRGAEVVERVDKLGRASRELAMCVSILEDDNNLLRDRLLKAGVLAD